MTAATVTPCIVVDGRPCIEPSHIVLFASTHTDTYQYEFAGVTVHRGQTLGFCLAHGGHIYDAIHGVNTAKWLIPYLGVLPVVRHAEHLTARPAPRTRGGQRDPQAPPRDRGRRRYDRT